MFGIIELSFIAGEPQWDRHSAALQPKRGDKAMQISDVHAYFMRAKWPNGFSCPRCGCRSAYVIETRRQPLYQCKFCRYQASLTVGTVLEGSRTPLSKWYTALQLMARPGGVNAVQLQASISVTYKTAWSMLRRVRTAISNFDMHRPMAGDVVIHPVFYGYSFRNLTHRHPREQPCFVARALTGSYMKMKVVQRVFLNNRKLPAVLLPMLLHRHSDIHADNCRVVDDGDVWREHGEMAAWAGAARQWIKRVYRGIGPKYLQSYWNEFSYRRNHAEQGQLFAHLCGTCLANAA